MLKRRNLSSDHSNDNQSLMNRMKKMKHKGDFRNYCFSLMKISLMTGFPVIAESKSSVRRTVKVLVLLVCAVGFFYQTWEFLDMYLQYPTITQFSSEYPEQIEAPAITMCNSNRLWRQSFCKAFPESCVFKYNNSVDFCKDYPIYCPPRKPKDHVFAHVKIDYTHNRSNEVLDALGPQKEKDLIVRCAIKVSGKYRRCGSTTLIQAAMDGYPYRCFSLLSILGAPDVVPTNLTLTDEYIIHLDLHPEEYMNPRDLIQAYVFIHDPRSVTNPIADGVILKAGNRYTLYVTMEKRESLPYPYESNCTDYLSTWRKNGGYGPITKKGCTDMCKIQSMMKEYDCVAQTNTYPNNFTICSENNMVPSEEVNALCSASCNDACDSSYYAITTQLVEDIGKLCSETDIHCKNKELKFKVSFSRMNIQRFKHEPKFQSVELFSYIGGYMGMWLGISLVSLFDFVEMLVDVLAYPVIKYQKRKRKINQVEKFQRNIRYNIYDI